MFFQANQIRFENYDGIVYNYIFMWLDLHVADFMQS